MLIYFFDVDIKGPVLEQIEVGIGSQLHFKEIINLFLQLLNPPPRYRQDPRYSCPDLPQIVGKFLLIFGDLMRCDVDLLLGDIATHQKLEFWRHILAQKIFG